MKLKYVYMTIAIILFFTIIILFAQNLMFFRTGMGVQVWPFKNIISMTQAYWWIVLLSMGFGISLLLMVQNILSHDTSGDAGFNI